jgi:hypothetical protein
LKNGCTRLIQRLNARWIGNLGVHSRLVYR